jgi:hypothetical protein
MLSRVLRGRAGNARRGRTVGRARPQDASHETIRHMHGVRGRKMGGVNQVGPRRANVRPRGTEELTFGALRRLPVRGAAFLANSHRLRSTRPEGTTCCTATRKSTQGGDP